MPISTEFPEDLVSLKARGLALFKAPKQYSAGETRPLP